MRVSIVVGTYNRVATLPSTLDGIRNQTHPEFEVIVVNGPSDDGTTGFLERHGGLIKLAVCAERNIARSRNIGVDVAAGEVVAFIDDDAIPSETWIEKLVAAYGKPSTAAAGGPVFDLRQDEVVWRLCTCSRFGDVITDAAPPASTYLGKNADPFLYLAGCRNAAGGSRVTRFGISDDLHRIFPRPGAGRCLAPLVLVQDCASSRCLLHRGGCSPALKP